MMLGCGCSFARISIITKNYIGGPGCAEVLCALCTVRPGLSQLSHSRVLKATDQHCRFTWVFHSRALIHADLLRTYTGCCANLPRRRHEENEPRSVGTPKECSRHDCAVASGQSRCCAAPPKLHCKLRSGPAGLPVTLSVPKHGDFPRSMLGSTLPVCSLRGRASPAS